MAVDSYLELYTTLIGWSLYDLFWGVLTDTGIVFLPFLGMVIDNFISPTRSAEARAGTGQSVRSMEIDIAIAMTVIVLAAQPFLSLNPSVLSYTKPCVIDASGANVKNTTQVNVGSTGTTYDSTFAGSPMIGGDVTVPIWWYATLSLAGGINRAMIIGIPCVEDLRSLSQQAGSANISDPQLRREYDRFASECYIPSLSKFQREQPNNSTITSNYGENDPNWIGSHTFLTVPGYYDYYRAKAPVAGCPFDSDRDTEYGGVSPGAGRPRCSGWWDGSECGTGLKEKLVDEAGFLDRARAVRDSLFGVGSFSNEKLEDTIIQNMQANGPPNWTGVDYGGSAPAVAVGVGGGGIAAAGGIAAWLGWPVAATAGAAGLAMAGSVASDLVGYYMTMYMIRHGAPMAQALILMAIYFLLPLVIVLSRYRLGAMFLVAITILAIKFWSTLWMVAWWVDQNLFQMMYPNAGILFGNGSWGIDRLILDMITTSLYLALPIVFTIVLGFAGVQVASGVNGAVTTLVRPAGRSAGVAGRAAVSAPTSATGRIVARGKR